MSVPAILGPDGRPFYTAEREPITSQHPNAVARWTREVDAQWKPEHSSTRDHRRGYHCQGIVWVSLHPGGRVRRESVYRGRTVDRYRDSITLGSPGLGAGTLEFDQDLPTNPIFVMKTLDLRVGMSFAAYKAGTRYIDLYSEYNSQPTGELVELMIFGV